jgi:transposase-like protein
MVTLIKVRLAAKHLENKSGGLTCPGCGAPYNRKDYRRDQKHIYCSGCKTELPKEAPEQRAAPTATVAPAVECGRWSLSMTSINSIC